MWLVLSHILLLCIVRRVCCIDLSNVFNFLIQDHSRFRILSCYVIAFRHYILDAVKLIRVIITVIELFCFSHFIQANNLLDDVQFRSIHIIMVYIYVIKHSDTLLKFIIDYYQNLIQLQYIFLRNILYKLQCRFFYFL